MSQTAILVKEKGVVRLDKPFDFMCSQLRNGRYKVTIERYTEPRTRPGRTNRTYMTITATFSSAGQRSLTEGKRLSPEAHLS